MPNGSCLPLMLPPKTWRRNREDKHNPGSYLHALCISIVIPEWYVPFEERKRKGKDLIRRKKVIEAEQSATLAQEKERSAVAPFSINYLELTNLIFFDNRRHGGHVSNNLGLRDCLYWCGLMTKYTPVTVTIAPVMPSSVRASLKSIQASMPATGGTR